MILRHGRASARTDGDLARAAPSSAVSMSKLLTWS
jgi:hypothetical protein